MLSKMRANYEYLNIKEQSKHPLKKYGFMELVAIHQGTDNSSATAIDITVTTVNSSHTTSVASSDSSPQHWKHKYQNKKIPFV